MEQLPNFPSGVSGKRQFCWAREGAFGDGLREQKYMRRRRRAPGLGDFSRKVVKNTSLLLVNGAGLVSQAAGHNLSL